MQLISSRPDPGAVDSCIVVVVVGFQGGVRREWLLLVRSAVLDVVCVEKCELLLVTFVLKAAVIVGHGWVGGWEGVFGVHPLRFPLYGLCCMG